MNIYNNNYFLKIGEIVLIKHPKTIITVLGSCVAVCMWDKNRKTASMCHYQMPEPGPKLSNSQYSGKSNQNRFGIHAIRNQLDMMLSSGSVKNNLVVSFFGGGKVLCGTSAILKAGENNINFARIMFTELGLKVSYEDVGGATGRKIKLNAINGTVEVSKVKPLAAYACPNFNNETSKCIVCGHKD